MRIEWMIAAVVIALVGCGAKTVAEAPAPPVTSTGPSDAARAYSDLKKQVAFGPRTPGSPGAAACRDWAIAEFTKALGTPAKRQDFSMVARGARVPMTNILAHYNPTAKRQIMLCAHWDTRPSADMEISADKKRKPIPGANDGASGVAALIEVARQLKSSGVNVGVQFVLFDGEDYGPGIQDMFLGAKYYAKNPVLGKPEYAILIDMIGDKDLQIGREFNSDRAAKDINDRVFGAAAKLGIKEFIDAPGHEIMDDHLELQRIGWKAIDLIDFDYAPWHTLDDTPEQCSGESLKKVADVLLAVLKNP